jgi:hypothetical protein
VEKRGLAETLRSRGVTQADQISWGDEFRIGLYGQVRRVLAPRGVKVRQRVQLQHTARYVAVAVDPRQGRLVWQWVPSMKGEVLVHTLIIWHQQAGMTAMVWDQMAGHKTAGARETGVICVLQPPVAPELNPTERIGEVLREAIEGKVYRSIEDKVAKVEEVLQDLAADSAKVKQLTGYPWILAQLNTLCKIHEA